MTPAAAARWARRTPASAQDATELRATGEEVVEEEVDDGDDVELAAAEFLIAFSIVDADATTRPLLLSITWA